MYPQAANNAGWDYLDLWDAVHPEYFLDTGLHLSAEGERLLIEQVTPVLEKTACQ